MSSVQVVVTFSGELLKSILVNEEEMEDISIIQEKEIQDRFKPSSGRDGWKGLIQEIQKMIDDEKAGLNFEFYGPDEKKHIFEECIRELGFKSYADDSSVQDVIQAKLLKAKKAEHRGFYKKAFDFYKEILEDEDLPEAQSQIAEYYYKCYKGEEKFKFVCNDPEDALYNATEYCEKAAEQGSSQAQYRMYEFLAPGGELPVSLQEAIQWLMMSARGGYAQAQWKLGDCYVDGTGVAKDLSKADEWYEKARAQGYSEELREDKEEKRYTEPVKNVEEKNIEDDAKHSFEWYQKMAENGNAQAQYELGNKYFYGYDVKENEYEAVKWYRKAAEQGYVEAQKELGACYYYGLGVEQDQYVIRQIIWSRFRQFIRMRFQVQIA